MEENTALEQRNSFVVTAVENTSMQTLIALVLAPATMAQRAYVEIKKRISEEKCDCQEISSWIELFTSLGSAIADTHTKDFFRVLRESNYRFSLIDLERFLLAFSIGRSCGDTVMELFLKHDDTGENEILAVIDQLSPMSRDYFFEKYLSEGRLSRLGYAHCMRYKEISRDVIRCFHGMTPNENEDMEELKKRMLAALSNRKACAYVFDYMLTLKMLSKEEVIALSEQDGMKQLANRALKNNLQPREED